MVPDARLGIRQEDEQACLVAEGAVARVYGKDDLLQGKAVLWEEAAVLAKASYQ